MREYENAGIFAGGFSYYSALPGTDEAVFPAMIDPRGGFARRQDRKALYDF
jgi:hypothetical protein